jgi:ABC-type nitrate/sulfonate/bicarbonate transport system substrate-binding protein
MKAKIQGAVVAAAVLLSPLMTSARAEVTELRMATQFGIGTLPMVIVQQKQLLEKHLAEAGLGDVKVSWRQFPGGGPMNDGLLSGSLDIVSAGIRDAVGESRRIAGRGARHRRGVHAAAIVADARSRRQKDRRS